MKKAVEDIEERYRPYQDMIDGLEGNNLLLQNQASSALSEAERLSEQYARLLGHQNTKQKIQHVKKLKDENANLKQVGLKSLQPSQDTLKEDKPLSQSSTRSTK